MRATAMMPYEVLAVRPGVSVVLRRLGTEEEIEGLEKSASKTLTRWDLLVARLNPLGPTGGPEIEMGAMLIASTAKERIAETFFVGTRVDGAASAGHHPGHPVDGGATIRGGG